MHKSVLLVFILALLWLSSCQSSPHIDAFDVSGWQHDAKGCNGDRLTQLQLLIEKQSQLLGWSEAQITDYLGPPDYRELYVRNQKFLIYYLEPTTDCGTGGKDNPLRMYVRLDALGDSREISLKNQ